MVVDIKWDSSGLLDTLASSAQMAASSFFDDASTSRAPGHDGASSSRAPHHDSACTSRAGSSATVVHLDDDNNDDIVVGQVGVCRFVTPTYRGWSVYRREFVRGLNTEVTQSLT